MASQLSVTGVSRTGGLHPKISLPGIKGDEVDFYDYGTQNFSEVRRCLGLAGATDVYAAAFQEVKQFMSEFSSRDKRRGFREIISSGASGSYFYFTPNRRFIVKTISKGEKETLIAMGDSYLAHCRAHPDTLIQYLGCHSIRLPLNTRKIYFVVMRNVLACPRRADLTFDLKGATSNRQRARGAAMAAMLSGERAPATFSTLMDIDFLRLAQAKPPPAVGVPLGLGAAARQELKRIIVADAAFLSARQLMDYSLLLGIVHNSSPPAGATGYGVVGGENGETYYLGIIDVLEQWGGMKWPMQGAILKFFFRYIACGRWYNPEGITAVPPDDYAARFEEFLLQEVLGVDAPAPRARTWSPFW